jgi:hypothetical protein
LLDNILNSHCLTKAASTKHTNWLIPFYFLNCVFFFLLETW